jgi:RNA polymerase sigma-70 factor (ECF subfamily)
MTGSMAEAGDLVQDSLVRAYRSLGRCGDPTRFKAWLFRILSNRCKTHLAKRRRRRTESVPEIPASVPSDGSGPLEHAEEADRRRKVHEALQGVSPEQREALVLMYFHGLSLVEMAELLSVSVAAVKMRLNRGRLALRARLQGVML